PKPILKAHHPALEQLESRETTNLLLNPLMPNLLDPGEIRMAGPAPTSDATPFSGESRTSAGSVLANASGLYGAANSQLTGSGVGSGGPGATAAAGDSPIAGDSHDALTSFSTDLFAAPGSASHPLAVTALSQNTTSLGANSVGGFSSPSTSGGTA